MEMLRMVTEIQGKYVGSPAAAGGTYSSIIGPDAGAGAMYAESEVGWPSSISGTVSDSARNPAHSSSNPSRIHPRTANQRDCRAARRRSLESARKIAPRASPTSGAQPMPVLKKRMITPGVSSPWAKKNPATARKESPRKNMRGSRSRCAVRRTRAASQMPQSEDRDDGEVKAWDFE